MFPDILPKDLHTVIGFAKYSADLNVPTFVNAKSRYDFSIVSVIHPKMIKDNIVKTVIAAQDPTVNKPPISSLITIKKALAHELSKDPHFRVFVDSKTATIKFPYLFDYLQTHIYDRMATIDYNYHAFSRYAEVDTIMIKMKEFGSIHGIRHILHVDIKDFFNNMYLHANSWALLESKLASLKIKTVYKLWPRALESGMQKCMEGATVGSPIGQSVFSHFAELFLIKLDMLFVESCPEITAVRVDDSYFMFGRSEDECTKFHYVLAKLLRSFKLHLNGLKAKCVNNFQPSHWDDFLVKPDFAQTEITKLFRLSSSDRFEAPISFFLDHRTLSHWLIKDWDVTNDDDLLLDLFKLYPVCQIAIFKFVKDKRLIRTLVRKLDFKPSKCCSIC